MARRTSVPILLAATAGLLLAAAPDLHAPFVSLWDGLSDRAGWQMLVSPAFPRDWPPPPNGPRAVVRYAYAMRLKPGLADGAEMAAPWAKITQSASGGVVVERLSDRLQPLGVQGVRPLRNAEMALIGREQEATDRMLAGGDEPEDGIVRDFACGWTARQGVVAAAIMPRHPAFARWLACR